MTWKSKLVAVVLILALCTPAFAMNDKAGHFLAGSALGFVGTTAENGFWTSVSVSAFKELADASGSC